MSGRLPIGPFDSGLRRPFFIECDLEGPRVTEASFHYGQGGRGVEVALEGESLTGAPGVVARICSSSSVAHSLAFCHAVEDAGCVNVKDGPAALRVVLAEYERIASHLKMISDTGRSLEDDVIYLGPQRYVSRVRRAFREASGNPFAFGMVVFGGVSEESSPEAIDRLSDMWKSLERECSLWALKLKASRARLLGARVTDGTVASYGGAASAPAFRASGCEVDLRAGDGAYGYYQMIEYEPVVRRGGTALERLLLLIDEVRASLGIIRKIGDMEKPVSGEQWEPPLKEGDAVGICESPTGGVEHRLSLGPGPAVVKDRIMTQVRTVAELVGPALSGVMYEDIVPLVLSFNLCAACIEL